MKERTLKNMAASVRSRLLNIARQSGKPFDQLLSLYGQERFLFRLSLTPYKEKLVLISLMNTDFCHVSTQKPIVN